MCVYIYIYIYIYITHISCSAPPVEDCALRLWLELMHLSILSPRGWGGGRGSGICGGFDFSCKFSIKCPTVGLQFNICQMYSNIPVLSNIYTWDQIAALLGQKRRSNSRRWGWKNTVKYPIKVYKALSFACRLNFSIKVIRVPGLLKYVVGVNDLKVSKREYYNIGNNTRSSI